MLRSDVSSMRDSVVLPAPDGDDSTSIRPRRAIALLLPRARHRYSRFCTCSRNCSTTALSSSPMLVSSRSLALEHKRIRFAVELLGQKVELAPDRAAVGDQLLGLRDMRREPVELLADVDLGGEQDRLLVQPVGVEALRGFQQRRHLLGQPRLDRLGLASRRGARRGRRALPISESRADRILPSACPSVRRISARPFSASPKPATTATSAALRSSSLSSASLTSITPLSARMPSRLGGAPVDLAGQAFQRGQHGVERRLVDARHRRRAFAAHGQIGEHAAARQHLGRARAHAPARSPPSRAAAAA